ncbi:neuroligin-4, Y-linked [Plodia interpunctella]|uniref:neuroligin-4, Y-linked n=1 Tax=Plodia interpunctella TaxID=58824 RepID=UPI00236783FF|nr:neuroligin-4, Y-linked [Plodia interpunctella]
MLMLTILHFITLPVLTSKLVRGETTMDEKPPQPMISSRVVRTKYGDLRGFIVTPESRYLEPVEVFRGVPYASPPVGSLRFMPPVSGAQWSGVKIAEEFSPVCPQVLPDIRNETAVLKRISRGRLEYLKRILPFLTNQSEDCLYLNIYAPAQAGVRDAVARYPVLVFVHGESYEWSSGNPYDGTVLASQAGLVVVTINYRLGILGFLNPRSDDYPRSPANYGLMDQIAALHWIKENVAVFGGDPSNVTLMGHGTGAACVHFLLTSLAVPEGLLFHRAILMSGSGLSPWSLVADPNKYAALVASHANCSPELNPPDLLRCLRERPLEALLSAPVQAPDFAYAFGPSVDGVVIDTGDLLINPDPNGYEWGGQTVARLPTGKHGQNAINIINAVLMRKSAIAQLTKYDLMFGVTKAEAYFAFSGDDVQYGIEADRRSKILKSFVRNTYSYHLSEILATIINEYTDWERPVQHPINIRDETLEALSDAQVVAPIVLTADTHSALRRNSYLYVFDYQSKFGDYPQRQGCIHGEELPYIFGAPLVGGLAHFPRNYTKAEVALSESVMLYWGNFAKTGNPNEAQESDPIRAGRQERVRMKNMEWTAYEAVHKKYLNIDTKSKLKNHYRAHRLSFWLNLVPDLHRPGGDDVPPSHHQIEHEDSSPQPTLKTFSPPFRKATDIVLTETGLATKVPILNVVNITSPLNFNIIGLNPPTQSSTGTETHKLDISTTASPEDGFAAYSTALSVTIAIGCSLLILNVLIFAGVYYQRDKTRMNGQDGPNGAHLKKRVENGQMPNNICGDLEGALTYQTSLKNDPATILSHHHTHSHHQLPPPEFADLPSNNVASMATLPRAPPPPKIGKSNINTLASGQLQENQPLLSAHQMQMINTSTLTKKNTQLNAKSNVTMEELRV